MAKKFQSDRWNRKRRLKRDKTEQKTFVIMVMVTVLVLGLAYVSFQGKTSLRNIGDFFAHR